MPAGYGNWAFTYRPTNPLASQSSATRNPLQEELFREPKNVSNYAINAVRGQGAPASFQRFFEQWAPQQEVGYNAMLQDEPTNQTSFADWFAQRMSRATDDYLNTNPFYASSAFIRPTRVVRR